MWPYFSCAAPVSMWNLIHRPPSCKVTFQRFPWLLEREYTIQLLKGVKPYALSTPWTVAILMLKAVSQKLKCMEDLTVIAKVLVGANKVVCRNGGSSKVQRPGLHLCGPHRAQPECAQGSTPATSSEPDPEYIQLQEESQQQKMSQHIKLDNHLSLNKGEVYDCLHVSYILTLSTRWWFCLTNWLTIWYIIILSHRMWLQRVYQCQWPGRWLTPTSSWASLPLSEDSDNDQSVMNLKWRVVSEHRVLSLEMTWSCLPPHHV